MLNTGGSDQLFDALKSCKKKSIFLRCKKISKNVDNIRLHNFNKLPCVQFSFEFKVILIDYKLV